MAFNVANFKNGFFDRGAVIAAVDKGRRKAMSKAGGFVRTTAQRSVKYGEKPARPGAPPTGHRSQGFTRNRKKKDGTVVSRPTSPFRELIFYAYDASTDSVVIGPAIFRAARVKGIPAVIEKGGPGLVLTRRGPKTRRFAPHPTMGPALAANQRKYADLFRDCMARS